MNIVKALEWHEVSSCNGLLRAETPIGEYYVGAGNIVRLGMKQVTKRLQNQDAAKAAAQADYEARILSAITPAPDLASENERLRAALTPSAETKAAYIGEFSFLRTSTDEHGDEMPERITVPWTTVKDIMKAIRCASKTNGAGMETDQVLVGEIVEAGTSAAQLLYGRDVIFHEQLQRMPIGTKLYAALNGGEQ